MVADASKRVFYNDIERNAFIESHCDRCHFAPRAQHRIDPTKPDCPHLERAAADKMPKVWTKRRNVVMGDTYKCADELARPPVNRRGKAPADTIRMFEAPVLDIGLVPVENWPSAEDFGRKSKNDKGDHA